MPQEVCEAVNTLTLETYGAAEEELILDDEPGLLDAIFDLMDKLNPAVAQVRARLVVVLHWCSRARFVVCGAGRLVFKVILLVATALLIELSVPHEDGFVDLSCGAPYVE